MARSALLIAVFYMVYAMIPILMGQSAGVNFNFPQFRSCNTSDILCVNDATISRHEVHLTNITNPHYKLTNKTSGRVVYSQTISLSSLDSFTTDFQFVLKYYNHSPNVYPYGGISFFMTSKEMATSAHSVNSFSGLPGNGSLSVGVVAVEFYSNNKVYTDVGGYRPNPTLNYTNLNAPLNDRTLWHARIDYNWVVVIWRLFAIVMRLQSSSEQTCEDNEIEIDRLVDQGPSRYKLEDLKAGTDNFSETLKLGQGGFGGVYKGVIGEANEVVAIKRVSQGSRQGLKEFISEISIVSRVRHRNLVQLFGWCHEKGELILVYEYMSNGSLDKHLFIKGDSPPLHWSRRYQIALEIACGLLYLHEEWDHCIVHRDVKSSNVMLDNNFNAKLGDFGLARILEHNCLSQTTMAAGTLGYMAPESVTTGRTSPESNVYSFGAVALEFATGRRAVDKSLQEHNMRVVEWVWDLYGQGKVLEAADEKLNEEYERLEMEQLIGIGLWCSHPDPVARPKMRQVVKSLKLEDRVPNLPPEIPVPTYTTFHGANLSVPSSFRTEPTHALPSFASISQSVNSSQVSSCSYSSTAPIAVHFQKEA
ncbi:L-type lectin-domain containing receptor kinase IX.2-like [Cryptomeria japonica]|uniref:L-type lectin-domain containing receptor kinase IX.2-like n=1 Tax=Cryptomeria japonica TaxID=3369 RepID=UPI0027DAB0E1|nr:L-type lectin-domain containing receptor kinase IX.2-like [Cryptomeria japonica]